MTARAFNRATLARQLLLRREPLGVGDAVRRVVALQAQQAASPYVELWNRLTDFTPAELDRAFADGEVVKATLMRITLHAVHSDDHRVFRDAMQQRLYASRLGHRFAAAGLTPADAGELVPGLLEFAGRPRSNADPQAWLAERVGAEKARCPAPARGHSGAAPPVGRCGTASCPRTPTAAASSRPTTPTGDPQQRRRAADTVGRRSCRRCVASGRGRHRGDGLSRAVARGVGGAGGGGPAAGGAAGRARPARLQPLRPLVGEAPGHSGSAASGPASAGPVLLKAPCDGRAPTGRGRPGAAAARSSPRGSR